MKDDDNERGNDDTAAVDRLPGEDIDAFLHASGTAGARRLDVAIAFARAMLGELRDRADEWERAAAALEHIRHRQDAATRPPGRRRSRPGCDPAPAGGGVP